MIIHFHLLSSDFIHFHSFSSTSSIFTHFHPLASIFIHFHPFSSTSSFSPTFIHFHPLFIHFHPFSSTFIHIHPPSALQVVGKWSANGWQVVGKWSQLVKVCSGIESFGTLKSGQDGWMDGWMGWLYRTLRLLRAPYGANNNNNQTKYEGGGLGFRRRLEVVHKFIKNGTGKHL